MTIIDAHVHLWLRQDAEWDGKRVVTTDRGRSMFLGEERQMLPPFMIDGRNTAEILLANMDYAQVAAAVVTQEYIDGLQNDYLLDVQRRFPQRLLCCGMPDLRLPGFAAEARRLVDAGFRALKVPGHRLILSDRRIRLTSPEAMEMFRMMEERGVIFSVDLAEGAEQVPEMEEVIAEYPRLKVAIGHFGCVNRPDWERQIMLARHPNVMIESGGITWLFNDEYYPFEGAVRAIRRAAELVGIDKLMWGSDYPRTIVAITYRQALDFVTKSPLLTPDEKRLFLGANAHRFYGFAALPSLPPIKNMSE